MVKVVIAAVNLKERIRPPDAAWPPAVAFLHCTGFTVLPDQAFIGINIDRRLGSYLLFDPPAEGIVAVGGCPAVGQLHAGEPVGGVVVKGGNGAAFGPGGGVAVIVVGVGDRFCRQDFVVPVVRPVNAVVQFLPVADFIVGESFGVQSVC